MRRLTYIITAGLILLGLTVSGFAHCEILDRIEIQRQGKSAEITIRFATQVQFVRNVPLDYGNTLRVYLQLTGIGNTDHDLSNLVPSTRRSPSTDMVVPFTVAYPQADGALSIDFDQPVKFTVRPGTDGRSLIVSVPVIPNSSDWAVESNERTSAKAAKPVAAPAPKTTTAKPALNATTTTAQEPAAAPVARASVTATKPVAAAPAPPRKTSIDRVDVERSGKDAKIIVRFTNPVEYARHSTSEAGDLLHIFSRVPGTGEAPNMPAATARLPETDMVPRFTLNYPDADGAISLAFDKPTRLNVQQGPDNRSIEIVVPVLPNAQDWAVQAKVFTRTIAVQAAASATKPATNPVVQSTRPSAENTIAEKKSDTAPPPARISSTQENLPPPANIAIPPAQAPASVTPAIIPESVTIAQPGAIPPSVPRVNVSGSQEAVASSPLTKEEIEARASEWIAIAKQAIANRNGVVAASRLNQVLSLPPNAQTETAQALMGEARQYSGETRKARTEYELYLKSYPKGEYVARVKEKLAALDKTIFDAAPGVGLKPGGAPATWTTNGSFSQYYYTGASKIETITPPPPGQLQFNRSAFAATDQNSLISSIDLQSRRRDDTTDTRFVVRETSNMNFLQSPQSYDRLYAAYFEQTNREFGYFVRGGRQLGNGGGVLGRFDGLSLGYNINSSWKVNAVAGNPAEFRDPFRRSLYGTSIEYLPKLGRPGVSAYYIEQTLEGVKDRQAVGSEIRYFSPNTTVFGMLDYDINYKQVNIAMMQANYRASNGTNYYGNFDIRKTPSLSLTTALPGQISLDPLQPTLSFRSLFQSSMSSLGLAQLRDESAKLTAISSFYTLGFIKPVTTNWQLGADYRQASVSDTGASGILPAQAGTGTSHVVSGQALGNNLWIANDVTVFNGSLIFAPTFDGQAYNMSYILPYRDWRFDLQLGYYYQTDYQEQRQTRLSPTLKGSYRLKNKVTFELSGGLEIFNEVGPVREQHNQRYFIFGGYRWDIQ